MKEASVLDAERQALVRSHVIRATKGRQEFANVVATFNLDDTG